MTHIPESEALPGGVMKLKTYSIEDRTFKLVAYHKIIESCDLGDKQKHGETPIDVQRQDAALRYAVKPGRIFHNLTLMKSATSGNLHPGILNILMSLPSIFYNW